VLTWVESWLAYLLEQAIVAWLVRLFYDPGYWHRSHYRAGWVHGFWAGALAATAAIFVLSWLAEKVIKIMRNRTALVLMLLLLPAAARAQSLDGRREIELNEPVYQGTRATAPIEDKNRIQNEGGSDGAGLCVIASLVQNGQQQGVPMTAGGKDSPLWRAAKRRPGGYSPGKLEALLNEIDPEEPWASYVGTDPEVLRKVLALGYPVGITYSWGDKYPGRIHHMVSGELDGSNLYMVADNNRVDPGFVDHPKHTVMTQAEGEARAIDGGTYWLFVWTRRTVAAAASNRPFLVSAVITFWGGVIAILNQANTTVGAASLVHRGYRMARDARGAT
jgi:hypothetical protein